MLLNCTLEHFKSVFDRTTLRLAPLTIFAGANSSGKSTIIQSLLLTTQTIQNSVPSRSVVLNGHILKLGEFSDVLSQGAESHTIGLGFSLVVPPATFGFIEPYSPSPAQVRQVKCDFEFSVGDEASSDDSRQLQPRLQRTKLEVTAAPDDTPQVLELNRSRHSIAERLKLLTVAVDTSSISEQESLRYETVAPTSFSAASSMFVRLPGSSRPVGASLLHFLPTRLSVVYDTVDQQEDLLIQRITAVTGSNYYYLSSLEPSVNVPPDAPAQIRAIVIPILQEYESAMADRPYALPSYRQKLATISAEFTLDALFEFLRAQVPKDRRQLVALLLDQDSSLRRAVRGGRPDRYELAMVPLPPQLESGIEATTQFFTRRLKYLGPLRDEPKPVYPLAGGADPRDIGYKGEHTAAVLETYRHTLVPYYPSARIDLMTKEAVVETTLYDAVLDWLQYMGIADEIHTADKGKLGHELKVAVGDGDAVHDLTHVGVGVSQVLPILVLALLAEPGSTLIFEQPELHLHPRVQSRLADFFVSLIQLDKQCLVETHSEYLINRLRYRAAKAPEDEVAGNTLLYFVERHGSRSHYKAVQINEYGVIEEWPAGFFDETEEIAASILREGTAKRRAKRRKTT